jgi:hypothetical protein
VMVVVAARDSAGTLRRATVRVRLRLP